MMAPRVLLLPGWLDSGPDTLAKPLGTAAWLTGA